MLSTIFKNDKLFKISVIISVICTVIYIVSFFFWSWNSGLADLPWLFPDIALGVCSVVLYVSYRRHNKNLMKVIIGFVFGVILMDHIQYLGYYISVDDAFYIFSIFNIVCTAVIIINHCIQNSNRKSNSVSVTANQVVLLLNAFGYVVGYILYMTVPSADFINPTAADYISTIADGIIFILTFVIIICVESRLDAYKVDREDAGWTEEEGYPNGYVHEYQKK